jgi:hypothetical protein
MSYAAVLPPAVDAASTKLEICFGTVCNVSRLSTSENPNVAGLICIPVNDSTPTFQTTCTWASSARRVDLSTNTVYGGHAGSDPLVVTAIGASGERTEVLRGTVTYTDTTDDAARGACTTAWQGTFSTR